MHNAVEAVSRWLTAEEAPGRGGGSPSRNISRGNIENLKMWPTFKTAKVLKNLKIFEGGPTFCQPKIFKKSLKILKWPTFSQLKILKNL